MATTYALVDARVADEALDTFDGVVDPDRLVRELRDIVDRLGALFATPSGLPLKTFEVDLAITSEGSVGFLGTGAKLTGGASIKLTFERPHEP